MNNEEILRRASYIVRSNYRMYLWSMTEAWRCRNDPAEFLRLETQGRRYRYAAEDVLWTVFGSTKTGL